MEMPVDYSTSIVRDFRFEHDSDTIITSYNDINLRGNISGATYSNDTPSRGVVEKPDYGYGLSFDGTDDFISLGGINIMGGSAEAITVGGVFKINATASGAGYLIQKRREFQILYNTTTNLVQFRLSNASTDAVDYYVSVTKDLKDGLHSIYGTWDKNGADTNLRLYIDGVLVATSAMTLDTLYQATNTVYIGRQHGGQYSNGIFHKVLLFNKALSATEISDIHFKGITPTANLVAQYLLNEGTGTTAIDTSGNGNNGTITGATYVKI
jgi:hypothetical protein